ncbi:hypothetical protein [uncultured Methanobrevibacter sp.]|uniref:hypothetical protein n=1 Tax=uncultured Methanobrevibacter sp. TaxID=253161 RepID=UPI0026242ED6
MDEEVIDIEDYDVKGVEEVIDDGSYSDSRTYSSSSRGSKDSLDNLFDSYGIVILGMVIILLIIIFILTFE